MLTEQIRPVTYLPILMWQGTAAITLPQAVCRRLPLSVPLPHLSALLGRKGHEVNQQKEYKQSEASLLGLPEFTLIQWIGRNPTSSRLRDSGKEQQGKGDGHKVRSK